MPIFEVTLKRTVFAKVRVEAANPSAVRALLKEGDNALDYFSNSDNLWGDDIAVQKVEKPYGDRS